MSTFFFHFSNVKSSKCPFTPGIVNQRHNTKTTWNGSFLITFLVFATVLACVCSLPESTLVTKYQQPLAQKLQAPELSKVITVGEQCSGSTYLG